ncbi:MAG: DUF2779 domain-containing protein [Candidatus Magasanikbacteria bacterium]
MKEFLDDLTFPLYFLDYETASDVIPPFEKTKPYQQIPFQYSLHILESPDGELEHKEYLHQDQTHPIPPLVEQLHEDVEDKGNVIVWHESFEKGRNEDMAEIHPEYSEFLEDLNERIVDLKIPFSEGWFVDKEFFGSASIKNVLPVLVPELSYSELEVQDGQAAQRKWMDAVLRDKEIDKEELFDELIEYCELDTLAMVEIWRVLRKTVN